MKLKLFLLTMLVYGSLFAIEVPRMGISDAVTFERLGGAPGETVGGIFWDFKREQTADADFYSVKVKFDVKKDRGLVFTASIPFARKNAEFLRTPYVTDKVSSPRIYAEP